MITNTKSDRMFRRCDNSARFREEIRLLIFYPTTDNRYAGCFDIWFQAGRRFIRLSTASAASSSFKPLCFTRIRIIFARMISFGLRTPFSSTQSAQNPLEKLPLGKSFFSRITRAQV